MRERRGSSGYNPGSRYIDPFLGEETAQHNQQVVTRALTSAQTIFRNGRPCRHDLPRLQRQVRHGESRLPISNTAYTRTVTDTLAPQNKSLCENAQDILEMQGVAPALRETLSLAVPHLAIKHHTSASGVEHIDVEQTVPGLRASSERRVLDGSQKTVESPIFGALVVQNRRATADELGAGWLKDGLLPETFVDGTVVHSLAQSDPEKGGEAWRVEQVSR